MIIIDKIPTRNGVPTKKWMNNELKKFDLGLHVYTCDFWGNKSYPNLNELVWQREEVNEIMERFVIHLKNLGLSIGEHSPYNLKEGRVGYLKIESVK